MRTLKQSGVLILLLMLAALAAANASAVELAGYELVAENEYLVMYFNPDTAEVAVYDQRTEEVWFTNPRTGRSLKLLAEARLKKHWRLSCGLPTMNRATSCGQWTATTTVWLTASLKCSLLTAEFAWNYLWQRVGRQVLPPLIVEKELFETEFFSNLDQASSGRSPTCTLWWTWLNQVKGNSEHRRQASDPRCRRNPDLTGYTSNP